MKKTKFVLEIDDERLNAINLYSSESSKDLKSVLNDTIQKHYEEVVPLEVRYYLETKHTKSYISESSRTRKYANKDKRKERQILTS